MRALRLSEPGRFELISVPAQPEPGPGEVIVRVHRIGVCGTDLHAYQGRQTFFTYPRILGHELGVEVLVAGDGVTGVRSGDRCAVEPFLNCGACQACHRGNTNCCESLRVLGVHIDGGMTEAIRVPAAKLHKSAIIPLDQLAVVEPLCIGWHAFHRPHLGPEDPVLVIGGGPIGLAVVLAARASGCEPLLLEASPRRLEFARAMQLRALAASPAAANEIRALLGGQLPRCVFDCTGNPRSMLAAFDMVAHGGELVFVGHHPGEITFQNPLFHAREITLYASRNATGADFRAVIAGLEERRIDVSSWLAAPVPAAEVPSVFPSWLDPENGFIKPLISWS